MTPHVFTWLPVHPCIPALQKAADVEIQPIRLQMHLWGPNYQQRSAMQIWNKDIRVDWHMITRPYCNFELRQSYYYLIDRGMCVVSIAVWTPRLNLSRACFWSAAPSVPPLFPTRLATCWGGKLNDVHEPSACVCACSVSQVGLSI